MQIFEQYVRKSDIMRWLDLPPLNALKAFAVLAEAGSFTRAGRILNVTHAAVLQQVKGLEERLGTTLVQRDGRGVSLTAEGRVLARDLKTAFDYMRRGLEALSTEERRRKVEVTCSPAFAVRWLMPRVPDFQAAHPDVMLMMNPTAAMVQLDPGGVDVAIRYTDRRSDTDGLDPLFWCDMSIVGTPGLVGDLDRGDPTTMLRLPWLQELGTDEVADITGYLGLDEVPAIMSQMPGNLIHEALRRGDGLTYTPSTFTDEDIRAGRLVELLRLPDFGCFHIALAHGAPRPAVRTFLRWLRRQAQL